MTGVSRHCPVSLEPLLVHLPLWTLVLFRITGIFMVGPIYGSSLVPAQIKVFPGAGVFELLHLPDKLLGGATGRPVSAAMAGIAGDATFRSGRSSRWWFTS